MGHSSISFRTNLKLMTTHHHVLAPIIEKVLDVPNRLHVGPVVDVRHVLEGLLEALREAQHTLLLEVSQGQL